MTVLVRQNNFDLLRLSLSFIVFFFHASILTQAAEFTFLATYLSAEFAVDAFFVVSGFLIFMSYDNSSSTQGYFLKRLRRILPGYSVVIVLSAVLFYGISTAEIRDYFNSEWLKYLAANIITLNFLQHDLPGVFTNNYMSAVNGALWTIKVEVMFYCAVPLVVLLFKKCHKFFVMAAIYAIATVYSLVMWRLGEATGEDVYLILERQLPGQMAFFIAGAFLYYYFERFKQNATTYFFIACAMLIASKYQALYFIYPAALAVIVIYITMLVRYFGNWGRYGDLSFGVYIWHFPLTQLFVHLGYFEDAPYAALAGLTFTVLIVAFLSWHLVEKRCLRASSHYRKAETLLKTE